MSYLSLPRPTCPAIDPPLVWHPKFNEPRLLTLPGVISKTLGRGPLLLGLSNLGLGAQASVSGQPGSESRSSRIFQVGVTVTQVPTHGQRLGSMEVQRLGSMEVYEAAKNQEWIKVEVRSWRPILAPSAVRREPSVWAWSVDP